MDPFYGESRDHILITLADFPSSLLAKTPEMKFRSLEKYLEKNAIPFDVQGDKIYIFVKDEFDARQVGIDFRLKKIQYFINNTLKSISLVPVKPVRQPRLKKNEKKDDEITSIKQLRKVVYKQKTEDGTPLALLMKRRILTTAEFKKGVKDGMFHPFVVGRKKYIPDSEIQVFLNQ